MKYKMNFSYDEVIKQIDTLDKRAKKIMHQKGNTVKLTYEVLYVMSVIDKSVKLIDGVLDAIDKRNITVLAVLTRVQMDCVSKVYALTLVENPNALAEDVLFEKKQMNQIVGKENKRFTDRYLAEKVGDWLKLPVYELYRKVCGFVHFSDMSFHTMVDTYNQDGFSMLSLSRNNPPEKAEEFERLTLELANQFLFFGNVLIDELFDSWVKQCLEIDE